MSEASARSWHFYLDDMIGFGERVLAYAAGLNQKEFVESTLHYDATVRNLELIGEAATHLPDQIRQENPQVPWRMIVATRNRLIHGYLGIDDDILWSIVQVEIPTLLAQLKKIREQLNKK